MTSVKIISAVAGDRARAAKRMTTMDARQARIVEAIDAFQSAVMDLTAALKPTAAPSMAIGRARKNLLAAIVAEDRSERLEA